MECFTYDKPCDREVNELIRKAKHFSISFYKIIVLFKEAVPEQSKKT